MIATDGDGSARFEGAGLGDVAVASGGTMEADAAAEAGAAPRTVLSDEAWAQVRGFLSYDASRLEWLRASIERHAPRNILIAAGDGGELALAAMDASAANGWGSKITALYSVSRFSRDSSKPAGFMAIEAAQRLPQLAAVDCTTVGGVSLSEALGQYVQGKIDYAVFELSGALPGGFADLLVCLPYMASDCTVVFYPMQNPCEMRISQDMLSSLIPSEASRDELLGYAGKYHSAAVEIRRERARLNKTLADRRKDLEYVKKKLAGANRGLEFYKGRVEKITQGRDFYKERTEKLQEGLDFFKERADSFKRKVESSEKRTAFYREQVAAKNRELDRCRRQMDSQDAQLKAMESSLSWRIARGITLPRRKVKGRRW